MHMEFVTELYKEQVFAGRYFLHEHPWLASSWQLDCMAKLEACEDVRKVQTDMCQFGMEAKDPTDGVTMPVQKRTAVLTNSYEVAQRLRRDCPNRGPDASLHHKHVKLEGGTLCKQAQVYPR